MTSRGWTRMDDIPYISTTVYLSDGSTEYVFGDPVDDFERILREKLGEDAARYFRAILAGAKETIEDLKTQVQGFERSADGYLAMCRNARDGFGELLTLCNSPRLDKNKLIALIREHYSQLHKNL